MMYYEMVCLEKWSQRAFLLAYIWLLQVFINSDKAHVEEALWGLLGKGMDMAVSIPFSSLCARW